MKENHSYIEYVTGFNDALMLIEKWHKYKSLERSFEDFDYSDIDFPIRFCTITAKNLDMVKKILNESGDKYE